MQIQIQKKVLKKNPKRAFTCDKCGCSSLTTKMYQKKTFPHGRKSKPINNNLCVHCKHPGKVKQFIVRFG